MLGTLKKLFKGVNPFIDAFELIGLVAAGLGLAKSSYRRTQDASGKTVVTPVSAHDETLIANAPKLFKKHEHVTDFAMLMHLMNDPAIEKQVMEVWIPGLSENQNADVIVRGALLFKVADGAGQPAALGILRNIGMMQHPDPDTLQRRRTKYADAYNWLRDPDDEYFIVKVEKLAKMQFQNLNQLYNWTMCQINNQFDKINSDPSWFSRTADRLFGNP